MQTSWMLYAYIAMGGAIGACLRYFTTNTVDSLLGKSFPFGTLTVNVVGSFCLALLYGYIKQGDLAQWPLKPLIGVGLLGAFTTFSTFSVETLALLENGLVLRAFANVVFNVGICLLAAWLATQIIKG